MNGYPVQPAKVQAPLVRDDTLQRDRLLDWLHAKIHRRVVLVLADAGYGKTTLLADFSRRTRLQTLWYRLDETDGDWVSFIGHLVAAGRVHDADFATTTYSLLGELAAGTANRESIVNAFIRDLFVFSDSGAALVLDDYHLIDAAGDVRGVIRDILARGPERLTVVISSRRSPSLPLGRLRAQGEVAELGVDDLRFDASETERLFRESYGRTLEPDVLAELHRRTEGWAASLHLVQTAGRDRPTEEFRSLVARLSGAEGHLYDYLAEEVLGELPPKSQLFLMRTSVLQFIDAYLASLVTDLSVAESRLQIEVAEQLGLLGRRPNGGPAAIGYHPLVKDVLLDRLRREEGEDAAQRLHVKVAGCAEEHDWHLACFHYASAGDRAAVARVVDRALPVIMGSGAFLAAAGFLDRAEPPLESGSSEVVRSRVALANGDPELALAHATAALKLEPVSPWTLANVASVHHSAGRVEDAAATAQLLREKADDPDLAKIGEATIALLGGIDHPIGPTIRQLLDFANHQQAKGRLHYAGIAYLNAAALARLGGDASAAVRDALAAFQALTASSDGSELAAARVALAWGLAHQGNLDASRGELEAAVSDVRTWVKVESAIEAALTESWYGSRTKAFQYLAVAELHVAPSANDTLRALALARSQLALREGEAEKALEIARSTAVGRVSAWPELHVERLSLMACAAAILGLSTAQRQIELAHDAAVKQGLAFWVRYLQVVATLLPDASSDVLTALALDEPAYLSIHAEIVAGQLSTLNVDVLEVVHDEATSRPERWREPLRGVLEAREDGASRAAEILAAIGEEEDVLRLRRVGRALRAPRISGDLAYKLARRLAKRVYVDDQLRVVIRVGEREIAGSQIRRKVLALLCFLLSRASFSATRDQVLDALWPDLDPEVAVNSLNQTVYFLRRVIEPAYREDTSPGYIHHDSDVIWLDSELVASRSGETLAAIRRATEDPSPAAVDELSQTYKGRFALEFSYEEWATPFRESLHASYLQLVETAIAVDSASGHYDRAIGLARRVLEVEPEAEQVEISLLRLYRLTGAHAAAAEQYAHYASVQRIEMGVEPPPLESL